MVTNPFSPEHDALRDSVRRFVADRLAPHAAVWDAAGATPAEVVAETAGHGYLAVDHPDGGADLLAGVVVAEEVGRCGSLGVAATLLDAAHGAAWLLAGSGTPAQRERWLAPAVEGRARLALVAVADEGVVAGPTAGSAAPGTRAEPDGDGWRLSGHATRVVDGTRADAAVVLAATADGPALLVADAGDGWHAEPGPDALGWGACDLADVTLDGLAAQRLPGGPTSILAARRDRHGLALAAAAVAGGWQTWEATRRYTLEREAFGRPIAGFQVNRHALADTATRLVAATHLVHDAVVALAAGSAALVHHARLTAARTLGQVADVCLQLHGGYGYSMEFPVQRAWRDACLLRLDTDDDPHVRGRIERERTSA